VVEVVVEELAEGHHEGCEVRAEGGVAADGGQRDASGRRQRVAIGSFAGQIESISIGIGQNTGQRSVQLQGKMNNKE